MVISVPICLCWVPGAPGSAKPPWTFHGSPSTDGKMQPGAICTWVKVTVTAPNRRPLCADLTTPYVQRNRLSILSSPALHPPAGPISQVPTGDVVSTWAVPPCWLRTEGRHRGSDLATGENHRETGGVWPAWLCLEEGRPCRAPSGRALGHPRLPDEHQPVLMDLGGSGCDGTCAWPALPHGAHRSFASTGTVSRS